MPRGAVVCEKIHSWHLASADDEINSARGCGSPMSTGHTPRFHRNDSATKTERMRGSRGKQWRWPTQTLSTENAVLPRLLSHSAPPYNGPCVPKRGSAVFPSTGLYGPVRWIQTFRED
ncbi:hypothetical protein WN48_10641 [Eufriesea mexicana]|uniref:Uncharacterized protein n=1 Tax=Eufriesea mexicana TaxID=516756 RepID=A0A310SIE3_9HYME|nr:hypothetical protein WN48_10641 [Eufriesea mexicana]